jgi:(p)ppGpp synthase/HD superfamily hydrolase
MKHNYDKVSVSLRYWLLGKGYLKASKAMQLASECHISYRKDGVTREFEHQIIQAHLMRNHAEKLLAPEDTLIAVFLHDVSEDYGVSDAEIRDAFGEVAADAVALLTKVFRGNAKETGDYYSEISECPIASAVKCMDRIHNLSSMNGVFSTEKMESYCAETHKYVLPMLKAAKRRFPQQESVYESMKFILMQQLSLYDTIIGLKKQIAVTA